MTDQQFQQLIDLHTHTIGLITSIGQQTTANTQQITILTGQVSTLEKQTAANTQELKKLDTKITTGLARQEAISIDILDTVSKSYTELTKTMSKKWKTHETRLLKLEKRTA